MHDLYHSQIRLVRPINTGTCMISSHARFPCEQIEPDEFDLLTDEIVYLKNIMRTSMYQAKALRLEGLFILFSCRLSNQSIFVKNLPTIAPHL
jgi:hypothetical protein